MTCRALCSRPYWQVALCHLFFNIFGIIFWYPIPFMRRVPLAGGASATSPTRV